MIEFHTICAMQIKYLLKKSLEKLETSAPIEFQLSNFLFCQKTNHQELDEKQNPRGKM